MPRRRPRFRYPIPRVYSCGPLACFLASEIAYTAEGTYRVFLPEPDRVSEIIVHVRLRRPCDVIRSDDRLHEGLRLSFFGATRGPAIVLRRASVENEVLALFCKRGVMAEKRLLRGDALLIESVLKYRIGIHAQLLKQERNPRP